MKNLATYFWIGILVLILSIILNISLGSVSIPLDEVLKSIFHLDVSKESWQIIVVDYRLPKAFTAILVGSGLALSGLLMQTLFRNPLARPYVFGFK